MSVENPKHTAYQNLMRQAERSAYWEGVDTGFTLRLMQAFSYAERLAREAGLSPEEIKAATSIGERLGRFHAHNDQHATYRSPDYWRRVRRETEDSWTKRYGNET